MLCPDMRVNAGMAAGAGGVVAGCATEGGAPNIKPATLHRPIESAVPVRLREAFVLTPPAVLCCARLGSLGREPGREPPPSCPGHAAVARTRGPRAATGCAACVGDQKRGGARRSVVLNTAAGGRARACTRVYTRGWGAGRACQSLCARTRPARSSAACWQPPTGPSTATPWSRTFSLARSLPTRCADGPFLCARAWCRALLARRGECPCWPPRARAPRPLSFSLCPPRRARVRALSLARLHTHLETPPATPAPAPLSVVRQFTQPRLCAVCAGIPPGRERRLNTRRGPTNNRRGAFRGR